MHLLKIGVNQLLETCIMLDEQYGAIFCLFLVQFNSLVYENVLHSTNRQPTLQKCFVYYKTRLSVSMGTRRQRLIFHFWVNVSFKTETNDCTAYVLILLPHADRPCTPFRHTEHSPQFGFMFKLYQTLGQERKLREGRREKHLFF